MNPLTSDRVRVATIIDMNRRVYLATLPCSRPQAPASARLVAPVAGAAPSRLRAWNASTSSLSQSTTQLSTTQLSTIKRAPRIFSGREG